jgi:hypothetical protein
MYAPEAVPCRAAESPLSDQIHKQIHSLVNLIIADVAATYEKSLTKQVALFAIEIQELRERERLRALEDRPASRRAGS